MRLILINGRSGTGKTVALHVLEELGFYAINNLPISMLPNLVATLDQRHDNVCVSIDASSLPTNADALEKMLAELKQKIRLEVILLDASNNTLLQRFSETRRKHPLTTTEVLLPEALDQERNMLEPISQMSDLKVDTNRLTLKELREIIIKRVAKRDTTVLSIQLKSFGYKYGIPNDADYIFDVRCLPNPYWVADLRNHTGLDAIVQEYFQQHDEVAALRDDIKQYLKTWVPKFHNNDRQYLTIAIGCTGGVHRSVYIVEQLAEHFKNDWELLQIRHRELA